MEQRLIATLMPVKRRQQALLMVRWGAAGLLASALAGVALGLARWRVAGLTFPPAWIAIHPPFRWVRSSAWLSP